MTRRIIIPAAGDAVRFGGCPKELLPISETDCSLTRAVRLARALGGEPVIISNPHKEIFHRLALERAGLECELRVRQNWKRKDLWGSIEFGLQNGVAGGLLLADTVPAINPATDWKKFAGVQLLFGVFETREPERFSILTPDGIATKQPHPPGNLAWGMMFWTAEVTDFLRLQETEHYDRAFEAAMKNHAWDVFKLEAYHDLGTFAAYREFLTTDGHR